MLIITSLNPTTLNNIVAVTKIMNLPKVAELTPSEAQARVLFASEDDLAAYLPLYQWPFSKILEFTH